jgi:peptide deformylase
MSTLHILRYPDPRLHTIARPVAAVDSRIVRLIDDMLETMYAAKGIGLAATQVEGHDRPIVLVNPELVSASDDLVPGEEGCLSVPDIYDKVPRHSRVSVRALDRDGQSRTVDAEGLLAVCIQHEMDHLVGKVFVELLSPLKRNRIRTKMQKRNRDEERV